MKKKLTQIVKETFKKSLLAVGTLAALTVGQAKAASVDWSVPFQNNLSGYSDTFNAGVAPLALDGHELTYDIIHPPGMPSGSYIQMFSVVDGYALTQDTRSPIPLYNIKTWETKLVADSDPAGLTGTNLITWVLPPSLDSLGNEIPHLIDYGTDSTRTTPVATIDMRAQNSYSFNVTNVLGPYRYLDFKVENIPEPSTTALLCLGSLALLRRKNKNKPTKK